MTRRQSLVATPLLAVVTLLALAFFAPVSAIAQSPPAPQASPVAPAMSPNVSVFATGFNGPRGLAFDSAGALYVAEAGTGGTTSTVGQCDQVPAPLGPYTGGKTARI